ncbi:MAG TPA: DNRLRE domain-containing protein [Planctomycetota bacterium]|nr:DNRLRE domain-containing protein [Planctomycetota bacterium]
MDLGTDRKLQAPHLPGEDLRPFVLPLRTRIALWIMFGAAMVAFALLLDHAVALNTAQPHSPALPVVAAPKIEAPPLPQKVEAPAPKAVTAPAVSAVPKAPQPPELAELEVLAALTKEDPTFETRTAIARIKPYENSSDEAVKKAAAVLLGKLNEELDTKARAQARLAAEKAQDLAETGDYPAALDSLKGALDALSPDAPWSKHGREQLEAKMAALASERVEAKAKAAREFEAAWRGDDEAAKLRAEDWLKHKDPELRVAIEALKAKIDDEQRAARVQRQHRQGAMRAAWLEFFEKYTAAVADLDLDGAEALCKPAPDSLLYQGPMLEPRKVLDGCLADVKAVRELHQTVLDRSRANKKKVSLALKRGSVDGAIEGVEGRQINLTIASGARVGVKVDTITSAGLQTLLGPDAQKHPGMLILTACENGRDAAATVARAYVISGARMPAHWSERMRIEKFKLLDIELGSRLHDLNEAVQSGKPETVKPALDAARASIKAFEEFEPLSDVRKKIVAGAEALLTKSERSRLVLQNGVSPADYSGINTDQISQYRESQKKTDVGIQYGLKVGSSGGVQRALIRFDGLENAIGKARVKKATLEMYQIESPQSNGSMLALFRLKKPWAPDAGTWVSFDSAGKNTDWAIAGCSGDADVESKEDAKLTIDARRNVWRSFDVTQYAQDVLSGKAPNHGFLLRVINGETDHHVRFFPETDLESSKDKSLRPKLILELEL